MIKFGVLTDEIQTKNNLPQDSPFNRFKISGICFTGSVNTDVQTGEEANNAPKLSFNSLLNRSDAILFLGDTALDQEKTIMALKKSRHIFLNRTPELTAYEYKQLVKLADEAGVLVCIKNDLLSHPFIQNNLRNAGQTKHIEIVRKFQEQYKYNSETLRMLFSDIQFISSIIGANIIKSHVNGIRNIMNLINFVHIHIEFDNGSAAAINYNLLHNSNCHKATFYQADKQIVLDFLTNQVRIFSSEQNISGEFMDEETGFLSSENLEKPVKKQNFTDDILNFLELITIKSEKTISFEDSFRVYLLAKEIYEKLEKNEKVPAL